MLKKYAHNLFAISVQSIVAVIVLISTSGVANAQTYSWTGATSTWETAANWGGAGYPNTSGQTAAFGATGNAIPTISTSINIDGINFQAGAQSYTVLVNTGGSLSFASTGVVNNSGIYQELNVFTTFSFNNSSTVSGSGSVVIRDNGVVNFNDTSSTGSASIVVQTDKQLNFSGNAVLSSAVNNSGTMVFQGASNATGGTISMTNATLDITGATSQVSVGNLIGSGSVLLGAKQLTVGALNQNGTLSAIISGSGGALVKTGIGTLTLTATNTYTGNTTVKSGALVVDGTGAITASGSNLVVGDVSGDNGTLVVQNGGQIAASNSYIGNNSGSVGTVTVTGIGSQISGTTHVGSSGTGTLTVSNGGSVGALIVGDNSTGIGTVTIDGPGSRINSTSPTDVGLSGKGTLTISGGATGTGLALAIGINPGSSGTVTVTGAGSSWQSTTTSNALTVGTSGSGTLTISDGGLVTVGIGGTGAARVGGSHAGSTLNIGNFDLTHATTSGTLQAASVLLNTGAVLNFNQTDSDTFAPTITGNGSVVQRGTGTTILTGANSYSGGTVISAGVLQANTDTALGSGAVTVDSGATLSLYDNAPEANTANNITISGTGATSNSGAINASGGGFLRNITGNVSLAGNALITNNGTNLSLNLSAINLGSSTLTLGTGFDSINLNGNISGSGGLVINTANAQIDGGQNTFTGTTEVLSGRNLQLGDQNGTAISGNLIIDGGGFVADELSNQLSANTVITFNGSSIYQFDNSGTTQAETIAGLSGTSTSSNLTVSNTSYPPQTGQVTVTLTGTGFYSYAGRITDSGSSLYPSYISLVKAGSGTQVLSGNNNYAGGTTISGGILQVTSEGNLGGASAGGLTFGGGELLTTSTSTFTQGITLNAGTNTLAATTASTTTYTGAITGTGGLTIGDGTNAGTIVFKHANTYSGGTTISAGTLAISVDSTVDSNNVVTAGGLGTGGVDIAAGAALQINAGYGAAVNSLTGTAGSLINFSNAGNFASLLVNVATGTNTYAGNMTSNSNGTVFFLKAGSGTLALSGTNNIYGIVVNEQGELDLNSATALSANASLEVASGATVKINGVDVTVQSLVKTGSGDGDIVLNGGGITLGGVSAVNSFGGNISGTGSLTVNASGNKQTLSGTNTYSGATTVTLGQLIAGSTTAFSANSAFSVNGTLDLHGFSNTIAALSGSGTVTNSGGAGKNATLTIGGTASTIFAGLIKDGTNATTGLALTGGTLILGGSNTYSGGTSISSGLIEATNSNALGTGAVTVDFGATLSVTLGAALANNITISGTGTTGQGAIYGAGTLNGLVTLAADSSLTGTTLFVGSVQLNDHTLTSKGYVFLNGPITGSGGLIIAGNQVFISSSGNSYTGLTLVKSGSELVIHNGGGIAISGDLAIEDGAIVSQDQASDTIASTSVLTIEGSGVYQLSDASGETQTLAGLQSTSASAIVEGHTAPYSLGSAYQVTLGGTGVYTYNGIIRDSDNGGFTTMALMKTGAGTQILAGTNSYSGGTTIQAGTLVVGSASALGTGDVTLNSGILTTTGAGTGVQLAIGGNYTQAAGGTLLLNLYSASNYDSLNLTGAGVASLNGTLKLNLVGGFAPGQGQSFTVLTSNEAVRGSFSSVTTNLPSIGIRADYTNNVTVLFQKPFVGLNGLTLSPNQTAVATYIDTFDQHITSPAFAKLVGALNTASGTPTTLQSAFSQLSPLNFASFASSTAFNNAAFGTQQLDGYLASHRGANGTFVSNDGGIDYSGLAVNDPLVDPSLQSTRSRLLAWSPAPSLGLLSDSGSLIPGGMDMKDLVAPAGPTNLWNVFVSGNVILAQNFSNTAAGISGGNSTTGAVQVGADYKVMPHWLVGAAFAYGHTHANLDTIGSNATVSTYSPSVYTSYSDKGWYVNGIASYGFASYNQNRNVAIPGFNGTANSSPGGNQIVGDIDGGYEFHRGNWTFGPTLGVQYTHLNVDGYSETGLPGANLTVNSNQADSLRSLFGGQVKYTIKTSSLLFTPHLSASWQHEYLNQSRGITSQFNDVGAGSFVVATPNGSRDSALADLGLDTQINQALTGFVDYAVQAGQSNYFGQSVQAGFKIGF